MWETVALIAAAVVLVISYCGFGRRWTYPAVAFTAVMIGTLLIVTSPPPPGYTSLEDRRAEEPQYARISEYAPRAGVVLWAIGVASLLAAAGLKNPARHP